MKLRDVLPTDIAYTHFDPDTGVQTVFNVSAIARDRRTAKAKDFVMPIDKEHGEFTLKRRGLESHRIKRAIFDINAGNVYPITVLLMLDGSYLILDGNHRYAAAYLIGAKQFPAKLLKYAVYKDYIIEDFPQTNEEALLASFSGIN